MSIHSRKEVVVALVRKYPRARTLYRRQLLDQLCSICCYERKYAIKLLTGNRPGNCGIRHGAGPRRYDVAVT